MHYLDNAATTPVDPQVTRLVCQTLETHFANPSSLYTPGMESQQVIDTARQQVAKAMGITMAPSRERPEILFTGSGTEANNLAILGLARARKGWGNEIVATGYEHPSAQNALAHLAEHEGFSLTIISPDETGHVDPEKIVQAVGKKTVLVAAMHVNNEIGSVLDIQSIGEKIKQKNPRTAFHVDAVQSFTKLPLRPADWKIDSVAVSAHKINGPKGVGALYLRKTLQIDPVFFGGLQEGALRPGTENTAFIAGFGLACVLAQDKYTETQKRIRDLHQPLQEQLNQLDDVVINSPADAWPGIINFSVPGIRSETMLHHLEQNQVYVSSGSACSKGEKSHTLTAMNLPPDRIDSSIRVSVSGHNTPEDIQALLSGLAQGLQTLARAR